MTTKVRRITKNTIMATYGMSDAYTARVMELEEEDGLTTSDAQGIADMEEQAHIKAHATAEAAIRYALIATEHGQWRGEDGPMSDPVYRALIEADDEAWAAYHSLRNA